MQANEINDEAFYELEEVRAEPVVAKPRGGAGNVGVTETPKGAEDVDLLPHSIGKTNPGKAETPEEENPWEVKETTDDRAVWSELDKKGKVLRVVSYIAVPLGICFLLYNFIISLNLLSEAFRLLGGKAAGQAFASNALLQNPVAGLMIGVLSTVLMQSSSTSTSVVVSMVSSGILTVPIAIPIIMGANIGTSVTNTIVSLTQSGDREVFRRAFGGATIHDMFNWLSVLVLLPLECASGYLYRLSGLLVEGISSSGDEHSGGKQDFLKVITKPITDRIIQLNKGIITKIANGHTEYLNSSLIKEWCGYQKVTLWREVSDNATDTDEDGSLLQPYGASIPSEKCSFLFHDTGMSDTAVGAILLVSSLALLCLCLILLSKLLKSFLKGKIATIVRKLMNAELPGKLGFLTGYIILGVGAGLTILVQSSSVFTSALTPLVGVGVIRLERMYPLTLGSNIGTTTTGLLAALGCTDKCGAALQIALCHLLFNISGIILFYPIPMMRWPIKLAKMMGNTTAKYRWFAIVYLAIMFFAAPAIVFALSMAGLAGVIILGLILAMILGMILTAVIIVIMKKRCSERLHPRLHSWDFIDDWFFKPLDRLINKLTDLVKICIPGRCKKSETSTEKDEDLKDTEQATSLLKLDSVELQTIVIDGATNCKLIEPESGYNSRDGSPNGSRATSQAPSRSPSYAVLQQS